MTTKRVSRWGALLAGLFLLAQITALISFSSPSKAAGREAPQVATVADIGWRDNFDSTSLDPRWFWVREDNSHWSLTQNPGYLRIVTQDGGVIEGSNDQKNILLTDAPACDYYQITTQVTISPSENFQYAGIHVYQDDDNYVQLNRAYANRQSVNLDIEIGGVVTNYGLEVPAGTIYLRIVVLDDLYAGYYSFDGLVWTLVGQGSADLVGPSVGLLAANNTPSITQINADFDFFELERYREQNLVTDPFSEPTLAPQWSWIREDNTHWSLSANPGYLRITTQTGGIVSPNANDQKNLLVREAPLTDCYRITTKAMINPSENYQYAGLQVYQDDDNFVQINRAYANGNTINFDVETSGVVVNTQIVESATTIYLRIDVDGGDYAGFYSLDGVAWTLVGVGSASLSNPKVGLAAANNLLGVTEINADFDFFTVENCTPPLHVSDPFSAPSLDSRWTWVNEDPPKWSLSANPGFLRMITDDAAPGGAHRLIQVPPVGNYEVRTRMLFTPTSNFQIAGIVFWQNSDNMLLLGRAYCDIGPPACVGNGIYFDQMSGGSFTQNFATAVANPTEAYLRVLRIGDAYHALYSDDGLNWTMIGMHIAGDFPQVGLTSAQDYAQIGTPADFDYFSIYHNLLNIFLPLTVKD